MTRPSQNNPACVIMNHIKQSRKNGGGGNYPQWMRTLEEKYQKLHKKIAENTNVGYGRFNSCVGRSVYDARLSQALLRYKDQALQKTSIRSKSTTKQTVTNNLIEISDLSKKENIGTGQNQYLDNEIDLLNDSNGANNSEKINNDARRECGLHLSSASSHQDLRDDSSLEDYIEHTDEVKFDDNKNGFGETMNEKSNVIKRDVRGTDLIHEVPGVNTNQQYYRKYLKTSVSRTSKITTKSCPAKLQSKTLDKGNQKRLLNSRSKSANRNDKFTPMSAEAKHAITETIHEMNQATSDKIRTRQNNVEFIPSRGRKCVQSWGMQRKTKSFYDVNKEPDDGLHCLEDVHSGGVNLRERHSEDDDDKASYVSSAESIGEQRTNSRLPDIQNGSTRDRGSVHNSSYRLPGIGKYDIAQADPLFEITPPGFDSRYNDVLVVEERESETPPPDIRQRAIDKCAEWLTKCNK